MRRRDERHLKFIRTLPCIKCLDNTTVEAAHVRRSDGRIGKLPTGVGIKPDDRFVLPLCGRHHREEQAKGEGGFWAERDDPVLWALTLYSITGDVEGAEEVIRYVVRNYS